MNRQRALEGRVEVLLGFLEIRTMLVALLFGSEMSFFTAATSVCCCVVTELALSAFC